MFIYHIILKKQSISKFSHIIGIHIHIMYLGDGQVTIAEFKHVLSTICTLPISSSDMDTLISLIDTNHDHTISFHEFLEFIRTSVGDDKMNDKNIQSKIAYGLVRKMVRSMMPSPMEHILGKKEAIWILCHVMA